MLIGLVAVGSELLTPYYQDTDSLFITQRLNDLGLEPSFKIVVGDEPENLKMILQICLDKADLTFVVGGLGPTEDDRTKETLAEVLQRKLIFHPEILARIEERFERRGMKMPESNRRQAYILEGAEILPNKVGTAPGQWIEFDNKKIILLPGPPRELQPMFNEFVVPKLEAWRKGYLYRRIIKITGLTESQVEDKIKDLYPHSRDLRVTVLAYPGQIEIHLLSLAEKESLAKEKLDPLLEALTQRLGDNIFSTTGEELEAIVGQLLRQSGQTLAVAESCTGGLVGHRLTSIPGSSTYFLEGAVVYSNEAKIRTLNVPAELIQQYGAVSSEVAKILAENIRLKSGASLGLSITGIAGPGGGSEIKPVGLVFTGLSWNSGTEVVRNLFLGGREQIKFQSSQKALDMLRRHLLKKIAGDKNENFHCN
ncbi:MAG: competence/damage-inducible protein A [Candidatus Aminicenantes bacterium]|nr:competence/damage-inducible protein A [Candidatus Aminicenantes bacterium]